MQGFVHLVLLALLFITSVMGQGSTTANLSTTDTGVSTSANARASNIINARWSSTSDKVFRGTFRMKESYTTEYEKKESEAYKILQWRINEFFNKAFESLPGYINTIIDAVSPFYSPVNGLNVGDIYVTVVHIFEGGTSITEEAVTENVNKVFEGQDKFSEYSSITFRGTFRMKESYKTEFENKQSENYKKLYSTIYQFFAKAFESPTGYTDTIINTVRPSYPTDLSVEGKTYVTVVHIFKEGATITEEEVNQKVEAVLNGDFTDYNTKEFPGTFRMKHSYTAQLENKESDAYITLHLSINKFFADVFVSGYIDTIIHTVSPSNSPRSNLFNGDIIYVTVVHIFNKDTPITEEEVAEKVNNAFWGQVKFTDANSKNFPGTFRMKEPYTAEFENKQSEAYKNLHSTIHEFFTGAFESGYIDTVIDSVSPSNSPQSGVLNGEMIYVTVVYIFKQGTAIIDLQVAAQVDKAFVGQDRFSDANSKNIPGTFRMNESYITQFEDKESEAYKNLHSNISQFFTKAFESLPGYLDTIIGTVSPSNSPQSGVLNGEMIYVTVIYMFKKGTAVLDFQVATQVDKAFVGQDRFSDSDSKNFPGTFRMNESYTNEFENKQSEAYKNLHSNISQFFTGAFESAYIDTIIDSVSPSNSLQSGVLHGEMIYVTVIYIFKRGSAIIDFQVAAQVDKAFVGQDRFSDPDSKNFPGTFRMNESYTNEFENKQSEAYKNLHLTISQFFTGVFESGYLDTIIDTVSPSSSLQSEALNEEMIYVTVIYMFKKGTAIADFQVAVIVDKAFLGQDKFSDSDSKNFPGIFRMKESYITDFENKESEAYKNLHLTIYQFFTGVFESGYLDTMIETVRPSSSLQSGVLNEEMIYVTVTYIFKKGTLIADFQVGVIVDRAFMRQDRFIDYDCEIFPGTFRMKESYVTDFENKESEAYKSLHSTIYQFFTGAFESEYIDIIIDTVSPSNSQRPGLPEGEIYMTIVHIFKNGTAITEDQITEKVNNAFVGQDQFSDYNSKEFPGTFRMKESYTADFDNEETEAYKILNLTINEFFAGVFQSDNKRTIIDTVSPSYSPRHGLRNGEKIYITVVHILNKDTKLTEEKMTKKVNTALLGDDRFSDYNRQLRPCEKHDCIGGSTCVNLNYTSYCSCQEGYYHKDNNCVEGKLFLGKITINASHTPEMENKESLAYQELHFNITQFFAGIFTDTDYGQAIIHKVSPSTSARYGVRALETMDATVKNILKENTTLTEAQVYKKIVKEIEDFDMFLSYTNQLRPCDLNFCGAGSCVNLYDEFFCQCSDGQYYKDKCNEGKVFPGKLTMKVSDISELENKESLAYQNLHFYITQFFAELFQSDYGQTVIHKISPSTSAKYSMRVAESVEVTVGNILSKDTKLTAEEVYTEIKKAIEKVETFLSYSDLVLPCDYKYCSFDSSCVNLNETCFCLCQEGYYYKEGQCDKGKIFPGTLELQVSHIPELEDKTSLAYQNLYLTTTQFFAGVFNDSVYGQTIIHKVSPSTSEKYVEVTMVNILNKNAKLTEEQVAEAIWAEVVNSYPKILSYNGQNLCDYYGCEKNDNNTCEDSFSCVCKLGMHRPNPQSPRCVYDPCPQDCTAKSNTYCQWDATLNIAKCVCLPDYLEDGNGNCHRCSFGYSGMNCQNQYQMILTAEGSVSGACIVVLATALIYVWWRLKSKKKDYEMQVLVENNFQKLTLQQSSLAQAQRETSSLQSVPQLQSVSESLDDFL